MQQQQRQKQRRQRWRRRWSERAMYVLFGGGERSGTDGRSGGSLIERMMGRQTGWVWRRRHCAGVEEGAGRAWEEKGYEGLTGCGCAEPGTGREGEVRTRRQGAWRLVGW